MAKEVCWDECGGMRKCKNYSVEESYCEQVEICYSRWLIECVGDWSYFYLYCTEYHLGCRER